MKSLAVFMTMVLLLSAGADCQNLCRIQVDTNKTFQVMEGFGGFNNLEAWKNKSDEEKCNFLVNDLGLSIMRFELPPSFQPVKDSAFTLKGEVFGGPLLEDNFKTIRILHKLGVKKFIATIWSPPAWMKTNNSTKNGGNLRSDMYEQFANYCASYCKVFQEQTGIPLYAIGLQNEPEFEETYNSCVYTPEQMREALRWVGRKFRKDHIQTKIYLPEALPAQQHLPDYFNAINSDSETAGYADIFAIHNYDSDGINVGGAGSREWEKYAGLATSVQPAKEVWMTETSGHTNNWEGAMMLAANIYNSIRYGNLSAWLWWSLTDTKSSEVFGLIIDGKPTGRYFASKQFYRFIRPGAIRVEAASSGNQVLALSFKHSGKYKFVSLLINRGNEKMEVDLPELEGRRSYYLSDSLSNCELQKNTNGNRIVLPSKSIATITWE